jgi:hypothetical protein
VNWDALLIAVVPTAVAAALHLSKKLPRPAAIIGGFALVFLIAAFKPLDHLVKHSLKPGLALVAAVTVLTGGLVFLGLELFAKDHAKKPLLGRKGQPHHWRAQYVTAAMAVAALMIAGSWAAMRHGMGSGWSQTWNGL